MEKAKIILLTGFLGAGKTSVLQHLLTRMAGPGQSRLGVIVNEFGKVSIDGPVLNQYGTQITELNNGSIFCQCLAGTFVDSIAALLDRGLDYLFVEATGLADPSNMQDILRHVQQKTTAAYQYAGVLCVVDAKYYRKLSQSLEMINRQILQSTLVVLNKIDLVDETELAAVHHAVARLNPLARILETTHGQLDPSDLGRIRRSRLAQNLPSLNTPTNRARTLVLLTDSPLDRQRLEQFIAALRDQAFRIKGLVRLAEGEGYWHIEVVGGETTIEASFITPEQPEMVIIPFPDLDIRAAVSQAAAANLAVPCELI